MTIATYEGDLWRRVALSVVLVAIAAGGAIDLALDLPSDLGFFHIAFELSLLALSLGTVVWLWVRWATARRSLATVGQALEVNRVERETALMLLKGHGHKEIATILGKSERTVRQQAVAVYRKSGLAGRAELSAFFLEDLLLPIDSRP
jgi:DNA-binding CsgD family transcriptional regulator